MAHINTYPVMIVVWGQTGCPACEALVPTFRRVAADYGVTTLVVDANDYGAAATAYRISETPTVMMLSYGRPIATLKDFSEPHLRGFFHAAERIRR